MLKRISWLLILAFVCSAADWSSLYNSAKLEAEKERLQTAVNVVIEKEITPFIPSQQSTAFGLLTFDLPLDGFRSDPLDFYSNKQHIVLPVRTLLFVEDLARAYGWMWANQYSTKTVDEYLSMLRYRPVSSFADHRYPEPLVALHIPDNALADARVVDGSVRLRRTAYSFLILHQFAHMELQHHPKANHAYSEAQEEEADRYSLEIMKNNSATPIGVIVVIYGELFLEGGADSTSLHPVTAHRLTAMAQFLNGRANEFVAGRPDRKVASDAVYSMALLLGQAAEWLSIRGHQEELQQLALKTDPSTLQPRPLPKSTR